jgi:AcrR family transcriptional regulator
LISEGDKMDLREKRKMELEKQKEQRIQDVVAAAVEVFKIKGIENTKMTDIAEMAEVGIASVYRYFKAKPDLVVDAANLFWQQEIDELYKNYTDEVFKKKTGIMKVTEILEVFLELYQNHQDFIKFIDEFDSYVVREKISLEKLKFYEENILDLKSVLTSALDYGKADGTIRMDLQNEQFYFSITHTLMSLCEKLVLRGNVLESDECVASATQIKMIIDMAVEYIKAI